MYYMCFNVRNCNLLPTYAGYVAIIVAEGMSTFARFPPLFFTQASYSRFVTDLHHSSGTLLAFSRQTS